MLEFVLVLLISIVTADNPVYKAVGDTVVFTLDSALVNPSSPIKSILWKHEGDMAVEWVKGQLYRYRHFNGSSSLNISTGALTITGLSGLYSGLYGAEINGSSTPTVSTRLLVLSPVPKPTVSKSCDLEMTYCLLTCEGNTTGAEPITYWWLISDYVIVNSTNERKITKEDEEQTFQCVLKNPVSSQSSDPIPNPFIRNRLWTLTCLIPAGVGGIVLLYVLLFKRKKAPEEDVNGTHLQEVFITYNGDHTGQVPPVEDEEPDTKV